MYFFKKTKKQLSAVSTAVLFMFSFQPHAADAALPSGFANPAELSLIKAAYDGDRDLVAQLLSEGTYVNAKDAYGNTPLAHAAHRGDTSTVQILIQAGANPNIQNNDGQTAADIARQSGHTELANMLGTTSPSPSPASTQATVQITTPPSVQPNSSTAPKFGKTSKIILTAGSGLAAAGGLTALALSQSGGSSSDSPAGNNTATTTKPPANDPPANPPPNNTTFETEEYKKQKGLASINAASAYVRGHTGKNVKVAVLDSSFDLDHPELENAWLRDSSNNIVGVDYQNPLPDGKSDNNHGTHVSAIIAAAKNDKEMHGVAYDAKIIPLKFGGGKDNIDAFTYAKNNGARLINNSWNEVHPDHGYEVPIIDAEVKEPEDPNDKIRKAYTESEARLRHGSQDSDNISQFQPIIDAKVAVIFANGNDGLTQPGILAGLPYYFPDLKDHWIAVAAYDPATSKLANFSNNCGAAADWCITAPGVKIYSAYNDGKMQENDGTSQATPHVSGALAVLMEAFPALSTKELIQLLFTTARKDFASYDRAVYGHGLLDLGKATTPGAKPSVVIARNVSSLHSSFPLTSSTLRLSNVYGDSLAHNSLELMFADEFKRTFYTGLKETVNFEPESYNIDDSYAFFSQKQKTREVKLSPNTSVSFTTREKIFNNGEQNREEDAPRFSLKTAFKDGGSFAAHYNQPLRETMGFSTITGYDNSHYIQKDAMTNPYLNFVEKGVNLTSTVPLTKNTAFKLSAFSGSSDEQENGREAESSGFIGEVARHFSDELSLSFQSGALIEESSFLGSQASGAYAIKGNTPTWFASLGGRFDIIDNLSLHGTYSEGYTSVKAADTSLFTDISTIRSNAFSLGITAKHFLQENAIASLVLSQPLRVTEGAAHLSIPTAVSRGGSISFTDHSINLSPSGREIDIEAFYTLPLETPDANLKFGTMYRNEPNHIKDAKPESLFLMNYQMEF